MAKGNIGRFKRITPSWLYQVTLNNFKYTKTIMPSETTSTTDKEDSIVCSETSCAVLSHCFTDCMCAQESYFLCLRAGTVPAYATNDKTIPLIALIQVSSFLV